MELLFILFCFLLCCSAFFSSSETALFSLSKIQVYKLKNNLTRGGKLVVNCLKNPREWLATILLGNELVNILISIIGASIVSHYFKSDVKFETIIAVIIVTPIILLFGEMIPKNLAIRFSYKIAPVFVFPLRLFGEVVRPFRFLLTKIAELFVIILGGELHKLEPMVMEEEFRRLVDLGKKEGVIIEEEREIIHNVFEFSDMRVNKNMTPSGHIFSLSLNEPYDEMLSQIKATLFSRIPIFEQDRNNIIGVLHVRDLFAFHRKRISGGEQSIRTILHKPFFISSDKKLEDVLRDFQKTGFHMAIVKENNKIIGIITMHDILEEIFGEIEK